MNIDLFRREHTHILAAVTGLHGLVQSGISEHAEAIVSQLISMSDLIKLHLAAEDRMLYPAFAAATDPLISQTGRQFQNEMGGLAAVYAAFAARWDLAEKITANPQGFRDDVGTVFKALHHRVQRENQELYPMAERILAKAAGTSEGVSIR